uniref:TMF-regulated nuclear protein 1-like protein n=1 Tax=Callorhinchus milii TaxID=7868 RepID=V9L3J5_CALMI
MGRFREKQLKGKTEAPTTITSTAAAATVTEADSFTKETGLLKGSVSAPESRAMTPSSSMEFVQARKRLLEMEQRQRHILEMERRLQQLHDGFVQAEQEVVEHGEMVSRIRTGTVQGEVYLSAFRQQMKSLKYNTKHRAPLIFASVFGLSSCVPWTGK